ncbi:MAG: Na+/H+ antiporter NhaA [Ignavibacteriae bacterium]|nr:Na+/H+ antiporter NhaA [Ignavibacteriota bacterium]MCB9243362.1 Na+/H+ antiporter NhaA [Ignavibacteriales bacterium]
MADTNYNKNIDVITQPPIQRILIPFQNFFSTQASGGIILFIAAVLAIVWANSPWGHSYIELWEQHFQIGSLDLSLEHWINDGLMAIFFFVVGLEIKRELIIGELSSLKQASLPIIAALGGMIVPAIIYVAFNAGTDSISGWGIPMATDIAFALGVLALLGKRIPLSLKIFLTALAIVDDLGAVLVIAIFYTSKLSLVALAIGLALLLVSLVLSILHVRSPLVYAVLGIFIWIAFLQSGVHATIAGVLLAFTIPGKARIDSKSFITRSKNIISELENNCEIGDMVPASKEFNSGVFELESNCEKVQAPMQRLEHLLAPWVAYFIMPVFALANAGLVIEPELLGLFFNPITLGIILGLFIGKQIGVFLFSWLSVKFKLSDLPDGVSWRKIYGVSCLAGIGFTMSLFISNLAFSSDLYAQEAKLGILVASLLSGILGAVILMKEDKSEKSSDAG